MSDNVFEKLNEAMTEASNKFPEPKIAYFGYNPAYDPKTNTYKHFKHWWDAVGFAQAYKLSLKHYTVVKVDDHYEIH